MKSQPAVYPQKAGVFTGLLVTRHLITMLKIEALFQTMIKSIASFCQKKNLRSQKPQHFHRQIFPRRLLMNKKTQLFRLWKSTGSNKRPNKKYLAENSVEIVGSGDSVSESSIESFDSSDDSEAMLFLEDSVGCSMWYAFGDKPRIIDPRQGKKAVPCCEKCLAPRLFEMQFFSSLFSRLLCKLNQEYKIKKMWLERLEEASVSICIFSCAKDCVAEVFNKKNLSELSFSDLKREYVLIFDQ
eukprot:GHVP01035173.1.p1 GENE.GHVP01035173.1~~GHVP01035173.1.p1  ORF type:complete len:242 (+),score=35.68 GHVP01035173.1:233-958(+)